MWNDSSRCGKFIPTFFLFLFSIPSPTTPYSPHPTHQPGPPATLPLPMPQGSYQAGKPWKNSGKDAIDWEAVKPSSWARTKLWNLQSCFFTESCAGGRGGGTGAKGNWSFSGTLSSPAIVTATSWVGVATPRFADGSTEVLRACSWGEPWLGSELKLVFLPSLPTQPGVAARFSLSLLPF